MDEDRKQLLADAVAKARSTVKTEEGSDLSKLGGPKVLNPDKKVDILGPQEAGQSDEGLKKRLFGGLTRSKAKPGLTEGKPEDPSQKLDQLISQMTENASAEVSLRQSPAPDVVNPNQQPGLNESDKPKEKPHIMGYRRDSRPTSQPAVSPRSGRSFSEKQDGRDIKTLSDRKKEQVVVADLRQDSENRIALASANDSRQPIKPEKVERPAAASIPQNGGSMGYQSTMPVYNPPAKFRNNRDNGNLI